MVLDFAKEEYEKIVDEDKELIERYIIFKGKCLENRIRNIEEIARLFKTSEELKR